MAEFGQSVDGETEGGELRRGFIHRFEQIILGAEASSRARVYAEIYVDIYVGVCV
jgi:hypothetical protein